MGWIEQCRVFCQVVESGSFTRAAEALRMPRSTVSTVVASLEARLGVQILNRTTRKVGLTREGEAFHARCLILLQNKSEMETMFRVQDDQVSVQDDQVSGRVTVSVPGRIGRLTLIPALPEFQRRWPAIQVEISLADRVVDVPAERVDCVLRVGAIPDDGLTTRLIGHLGQINVASPAYLQRYGVPRTPQDLQNHRQVGYISPVSGRIMGWEWAEDGAERQCQMPWDISTDTGEGYIAGALAGLGMIQIPAYDVVGHLEDGTLIEVMETWRPLPLPVTLGIRSTRSKLPAIDIFARWLATLTKTLLEK